jgi:hypothetical protein
MRMRSAYLLIADSWEGQARERRARAGCVRLRLAMSSDHGLKLARVHNKLPV